ncbi:MAG: dihydrodipicolinate synthase family protein [Bacteroidales bacterium]|nr:dihydrodipicolinate synthase family protein [Bacteroidales bacterium]
MCKPAKKYRGVIVPMVTPLNNQFNIDEEAVERIVDSFVEAGVSPFLLGTTGESVSVSFTQKKNLVRKTVVHSNKRSIVYAGISGNCLEDTIEEGKAYADMGVDALVAHLPFYYPLSPDQMLRYYEQIADNVPAPLFLYNNPITTKFSIPLEVVEKLSYHSNIVGLKDSERGLERLDTSISLWADREDFSHLLGWAAQSAYALQKGSDGIVPSTGNISPKLYRDLYDAAIRGDALKALALQEITNQISEIYQLNRNISQSIPALKVMMHVKGLCKPCVLPPMYELEKDEVETIIGMTKEQMNKQLV